MKPAASQREIDKGRGYNDTFLIEFGVFAHVYQPFQSAIDDL